MKISALAITSLVSSVSADFSLRGISANDLLSSGQTEIYDARIVVGGLRDVISDEEGQQVAKVAMAAYNDVFRVSNTGQKINGIETTAATTIPSDRLWWTGECRFCSEPPPFSSSKLDIKQEETAFINARVELSSFEDSVFLGLFLDQHDSNPKALHHQFEEGLCQRLRLSGMRNFAKAEDCSFSFLAKPGMTKQVPAQKTYTESKDNEAQAELILVGLKNEMTLSDVQFLNEVVVSAHNEAFAKFGLVLG